MNNNNKRILLPWWRELKLKLKLKLRKKRRRFYHDNNDSNTSLENFYGLDNEFLFNSITIK